MQERKKSRPRSWPPAVRRALAVLIQGERPQDQLTDAQIAACLTRDGLPVGVSTIAKYRGEMGIPPRNARRTLPGAEPKPAA